MQDGGICEIRCRIQIRFDCLCMGHVILNGFDGLILIYSFLLALFLMQEGSLVGGRSGLDIGYE